MIIRKIIPFSLTLKKDWLHLVAGLFLWYACTVPCSGQHNPFHAQQLEPGKPRESAQVSIPFLPGFNDPQPNAASNVQAPDSAKPDSSLSTPANQASQPRVYTPFLSDTLYAYIASADTFQIKQRYFRPHALETKEQIVLEKNSKRYDWAFTILVIAFLLLAAVQYNYHKRFSQIFRAFLTGRQLNQLLRGSDFYKERITYNLFIIFLLCFPLLLVLVNQTYSIYPLTRRPFTEFLFYLELFVLNLALYSLKVIAIRGAGQLFKTYHISSEYLITHFIFSLIEGVYILVVLVIFMYTRAEWFLQGALVLLGLVYAYQLVRGLLIGLADKMYSMFYLILFFMTIEILPILLIIKFVRVHS